VAGGYCQLGLPAALIMTAQPAPLRVAGVLEALPATGDAPRGGGGAGAAAAPGGAGAGAVLGNAGGAGATDRGGGQRAGLNTPSP
jgi:hypothetical protein